MLDEKVYKPGDVINGTTFTASWVQQDEYVYEEKVSRWILLKWLLRGSFRIHWFVKCTNKRKGLYIKGKRGSKSCTNLH